MSYEITIKERREVRRVCGKEWVQIGTKEVLREDGIYSRSVDESRTRIEPVYGYSPEIERTVIEDREVLRQAVDEIDLAAVIRAVNKL